MSLRNDRDILHRLVDDVNCEADVEPKGIRTKVPIGIDRWVWYKSSDYELNH